MRESERQYLVEKLYKKGIKDKTVLKAILNVERHLFVPTAVQQHAYEDVALPIGGGQTISQPSTVAFMSSVLSVNPGDKVLEIGTGSGYQAAVLSKMGIRVFSIERVYELFIKTQKMFDEMRIQVTTRFGDGTIGWEEYAPFKGIIVTAGAPSIPEALKKQLDINAKLIIPVGDKSSQKLIVMRKNAPDSFSIEEIPNFAFVPLIGRDGWQG